MVATQQCMVLDQNKELIFKAYEALNQGDIENFGELLSEDFQEIAQNGDGRSKEECLNAFRDLRVMMPDVRFDIKETIAEGDKVVVVENYSGTMTGKFRAQEPTGRKMSVVAVDIYTIRDGKIAELQSIFDTASVVEQLGLGE